MSIQRHSDLAIAIVQSDRLAESKCLYEAFINMNKFIMNKFSRMGMVKAISYLFQIVDECSVQTHVFRKTFFLNASYEDAAELAHGTKRKSQMNLWAGCIKICQFRNENRISVEKRLENLMKARQHFEYTLDCKPKHIIAPYLLTACDNAFRDMGGTIPYPENASKTPDDYYNQAGSHEKRYLLLSFVLGTLTYYLEQYYEAECYLNMVLCEYPSSSFEDRMSHHALMLLNQIAVIKAKKANQSTE